jgi:hypothetical protein
MLAPFIHPDFIKAQGSKIDEGKDIPWSSLA